MSQAINHNPLYTDETITLTAPIQELVFDDWAMSQLPEVNGLIAALPCSGASVAGKTKRKLSHAEDHPDVGHLAVAFLALIGKVAPAYVCLENVTPYSGTASMSIIRNQLRDLGYNLHEMELNAADWNMLEHRKRFCMIAVTSGIDFDPATIERPAPRSVKFGDIMENVDPSHSTWGSIDYLFAKEARDKAEGKGFAPTIVDANTEKLGVLNKTLSKRQSTGCFIKHPEDDTYRIPTVKEHARAKGCPEMLVEGVSQTFGHESLGQAVSLPPFRSVFKALGEAIKAFCAKESATYVPLHQYAEAVG